MCGIYIVSFPFLNFLTLLITSSYWLWILKKGNLLTKRITPLLTNLLCLLKKKNQWITDILIEKTSRKNDLSNKTLNIKYFETSLWKFYHFLIIYSSLLYLRSECQEFFTETASSPKVSCSRTIPSRHY